MNVCEIVNKSAMPDLLVCSKDLWEYIIVVIIIIFISGVLLKSDGFVILFIFIYSCFSTSSFFFLFHLCFNNIYFFILSLNFFSFPPNLWRKQFYFIYILVYVWYIRYYNYSCCGCWCWCCWTIRNSFRHFKMLLNFANFKMARWKINERF